MKLVTNQTGNISARYKDSNGQWRSTNLRTKNKKEAHKIAKDLRIEDLEDAGKMGILSREVVAKMVGGKDIKLKNAIAEYMEFMEMQASSANTLHTYSCNLLQFMKDYGYVNAGISLVKEKDVYDFINRDDAKTVSNRNLRRATLSSFFKFACARTYIVFNPTVNVRIDSSKMSHEQKEKKERVPFTKKEFKKISSCDHDFFRPATAISYCTGLRLGDICSLEWASIDPYHITVWTEKRDKRVQIPIEDELFGGGMLTDIITSLKIEDDTYVFPEWQEVISNPKTRSKPSVYFSRLLYGDARGNGLGGNQPLFPDIPKAGRKSFHCLRHSFVTRLAKAGVSIEEIGKAVGHSDTATTLGYSH